MFLNTKDTSTPNESVSVHSTGSSSDDDKELEALGYVPSFKREFSNLATVWLVCAFLSIHSADAII